jgi:zinc protease
MSRQPFTIKRFSPESRLGRCVTAAAGVVIIAFAALAARASERLLPPAVPSPRPIELPIPDIRTLPNGLHVLVVERHALPVLTLRLLVRAGAESDPAGLPGIAQLTAGLLNEGTEHQSADQIAEAIDGAGGTVDSNAGWDRSYLVLTMLSDHANRAFDLMAEMVIEPAFLQPEVERARRQTLSALNVLHNDPGYLADTVVDQLLFANSPYGHPADGTLAAVKSVRPTDLAAFHARVYVPEKSVLAVVGDITAASAFEHASRYFGNWDLPSGGTASAPAKGKPTNASLPAGSAAMVSDGVKRIEVEAQHASALPRVLIIDKPDTVQTEIRVANRGIARSSADYVALTVANQILGGPASNRLFSDLRGEHGLTYGASSDLDCYLATGAWVAKTSTRTAETAKAVHRVLVEMDRMRNQPISREDLQQAVDYLTGHQALDFETSEGIASQFLELMAYHLPLNTWSSFPAALRRLTPGDVWKAARRYLDPDQAVIVLVGDGSAFEKDIRRLGPTRVIPIDRLDLGSPSLTR